MTDPKPSPAARQALALSMAGVITFGLILLALALRHQPPL